MNDSSRTVVVRTVKNHDLYNQEKLKLGMATHPFPACQPGKRVLHHSSPSVSFPALAWENESAAAQ